MGLSIGFHIYLGIEKRLFNNYYIAEWYDDADNNLLKFILHTVSNYFLWISYGFFKNIIVLQKRFLALFLSLN